VVYNVFSDQIRINISKINYGTDAIKIGRKVKTEQVRSSVADKNLDPGEQNGTIQVVKLTGFFLLPSL